MSRLSLIFLLLLCVLVSETFAAESTVHRDIEYAKVDDHSLLLDLYVPDREGPHPVIVWVHGGAWRAGSKKSMPLDELVNMVDDRWCLDQRVDAGDVDPLPVSNRWG